MLNREVRVVLEGIDKHNNLLGSLVYPETGSVAENQLLDLGVQLVSRGLAKVTSTRADACFNHVISLQSIQT